MPHFYYWNLISLPDTGMTLGALVLLGGGLAILIGSLGKFVPPGKGRTDVRTWRDER